MGNAQGEISYILAIGQDITQSQQAEAELRMLNQELEKRVQERTNALLKINRQLRSEICERQRLETVLRREIDLLARVMETSPVGILMANAAGIILIASEQAQEILKLKQKNYPWSIYSNPEWHITDEQGRMVDNEKLPFTQVIRSHQSVYNHRHIVKLADGREVLLSVNAAPLLQANKTLEGVVFALEDITERVQTEQALLHSEAQFRAIFEQAAVGIGIVALSGKFLRVNQCYCDLLGYMEAELLGKTCQEITHPDDLDANSPSLVQGVKQAMRTFSGEKRYLRADNSFIWVNLSSSIVRNPEGKPLYMITIIEDISERHRALQALRESEERFRRIIETANEGVWIIDSQNNTTFVNQRMAQMLGYSVMEMLGRSLLQFMDTPSQSLAKEEMELRQRGSNQHHDFRFRCKDGSHIWTMISTNPIFDELGNYAGTLGMLTDITERKETEQALERANHQLTA